MKLEVHKVYRTRAGALVEIVMDDGTTHMPFYGSNGFWYYPDGSLSRNPDIVDSCDIVGEHQTEGTTNKQIAREWLPKYMDMVKAIFDAIHAGNTEVETQSKAALIEWLKQPLILKEPSK